MNSTLEIVPASEVINVRQIGAVSPKADKAAGKRYTPRTVAWDEEVIIAPMRSPNMKAIPGEFGVFAKQDQTFLGRYSRKENYISNRFLLGLFEEALASMGVTWERTVRVADYGAVMHATYTFPSITADGPDGKRIAFRLTLSNSYNGKFKLEAMAEALRLVCLNGMKGFGKVFSISQRHSGLVDVPGIVASVTPQIENGLSGMLAPMQKLADFRLTDAQGEFVLRNLFKANPLKFSGLMARRIETAWANPADDEKASHGTAWGLLNAGTRTFRDMEDSKVALVQRTAPFFTDALSAMTGNVNFQARLLAPISRESAYSRDTGDE